MVGLEGNRFRVRFASRFGIGLLTDGQTDRVVWLDIVFCVTSVNVTLGDGIELDWVENFMPHPASRPIIRE